MKIFLTLILSVSPVLASTQCAHDPNVDVLAAPTPSKTAPASRQGAQ